MTYEEWAATHERGVTITPEMAFEAGAASRDAEIAELREANRIACEDIVVQQNLRVTYAEQIAELKDALGYDWDKYKASQEALLECMKMVAEQDAEIAELVAALKGANDLTEILRMPNIEHVADAHNKAVRSLRAALAKMRKP